MIESFRDKDWVMDNIIINTDLRDRIITGTKDAFHPVPKLFRVTNIMKKTISIIIGFSIPSFSLTEVS